MMAPQRPAKSGLIAIAPIIRRAAIALSCSLVAAIGAAICAPGVAAADPAATATVPLPVPAPLPKTGTAPPAPPTNQTPAGKDNTPERQRGMPAGIRPRPVSQHGSVHLYFMFHYA